MITYKQESARVIFDEGADLLSAHNDETPEHTKEIKADPNIEQYIALEDAGVLFVLTVRDCGTLIGYSVFVMSPSLHHKTLTYAVNDVLFLAEPYRKTGVGLGLLEMGEVFLKTKGVDMMVVMSKVNTPLDYLLKSTGYTHTENAHIKYLGGK